MAKTRALLSLAWLVLFAILPAVLPAQAQRPEFEVATVRQSSPDTVYDSFVPTLNVAPGATLRIVNRQLKELIMLAWGIGGRQLAGPQWLIDPGGDPKEVPRFDIAAKTPASARREQIPMMLQNLLQERFQLRTHHEQRQLVIYSLETAKGGMKIKPLPEGAQGQSGCTRNLFGDNGITTAICPNMTPAQLARQLSTLSPAYFPEGPVVDKTGNSQAYDFTLEWITQQQRDEGQDGPSMYDAVEKSGLHINREKGAADVLVVDRATQKPTDN